MRPRNVKIVISLALVVVAIVLLIATSTTRSGYTTHYYHSASEFLAKSQDYVNSSVRVNGRVIVGTVRRMPVSEERALPALDFVLGDSLGARVPVTYVGTTVPDAFREGADLVVEGVYTSEGVLEAKQLLVKCPSKYETAPTDPGAGRQTNDEQTL